MILFTEEHDRFHTAESSGGDVAKTLALPLASCVLFCLSLKSISCPNERHDQETYKKHSESLPIPPVFQVTLADKAEKRDRELLLSPCTIPESLSRKTLIYLLDNMEI